MMEVTCAVITDGSQVLVTRRSAGMPHALKWEFPGGKIRKGETAEQCIRREIREELGVEIRVERPLPPVVHLYDDRTVRLIPFICHIGSGAISLSEHQEFRWVSCHELEGLDWLDADIGVVRMVKAEIC